jgi:hypothetical protein
MAKQTNNDVFEVLRQYNKSILPRQLILMDEVIANPALKNKWLSNWNLIQSWILARWGSEETPATFTRVQQAVSALHKNGAGLQWMDGKQPGISRDQKQPESEHKNTQADLIERQEADRKAKVDATTLANAQSRCSNYDCQPHSVRFDRRNRLLAEFKRLSETPGITAEQVAKGVDQAIIAMEKTAPAPQPIRGV